MASSESSSSVPPVPVPLASDSPASAQNSPRPLVPPLPGRPLADAYGFRSPAPLRPYLALLFYLTTIAGRGSLPADVAVATPAHLRRALGRSDAWLYAALLWLARYGYVYALPLPTSLASVSSDGARMFCLRVPDYEPGLARPPLAAVVGPVVAVCSWRDTAARLVRLVGDLGLRSLGLPR